ncbi:MAG: TonB family protein [Bacteroidetes bacterium]|nr:TonB family protein [Bacteroidota bacterium]
MADLHDDIIKYKKGELTPAEMHALEKRALSDPLLAEALEGIDLVEVKDAAADVAEINDRLLKKKRRVFFTPLRIAAGVLIVLGVVFFLIEFPRENTVAYKAKEAPSTSDSAALEDVGGIAMEKSDVKTEPLADSKNNLDQTTQAAKPHKSSGDIASLENRKSEPKEVESVKAAPTQELALADESELAKSKIVHEEKELAGSGNVVAQPQMLDQKKESLAMAKRSEAPAVVKMTAMRSVSGKVVSEQDGLPLPGVNVMLKGTSEGAITDANGNYTLHTTESIHTVIFSFIGFQSEEADIAGKDKLDVKMKEDAAQLSEVVVTGYGSQREENAEPVIRLAAPVGGRKAYDKYLDANLRYPQEALENKIKGRVVVEFNVGLDGSLTNFSVIKSLGHGCDEEVIRLVKEGPQWKPTTEDDKPVESTVRVRMKFDPAKANK